jgi:hypothetical protein
MELACGTRRFELNALHYLEMDRLEMETVMREGVSAVPESRNVAIHIMVEGLFNRGAAIPGSPERPRLPANGVLGPFLGRMELG